MNHENKRLRERTRHKGSSVTRSICLGDSGGRKQDRGSRKFSPMHTSLQNGGGAYSDLFHKEEQRKQGGRREMVTLLPPTLILMLPSLANPENNMKLTPICLGSKFSWARQYIPVILATPEAGVSPV